MRKLNITNTKIVKRCVMVVLAMFCFGFLMVPLYNVFCDVTGLNGKIDLSQATVDNSITIEDRVVTVEFVVNYNQKMPWLFKPQHKILKVHPGELIATGYFAKNPTTKTITARAIPSISPGLAAEHFKKIECFCFDEQVLGPGEYANLPLRFYLSPDLPKKIKRLTLSYTLFDMEKEPIFCEGVPS